MHAKQYDFTLPASGIQRLPVTGDLFKVVGATGRVKVITDTGAQIECQAGQGIRGYQFGELTLIDKSGATNSGFIVVGQTGRGDVIDDRVTGEVSVIDGGKAKTLAGNAYLGYASETTTGANHAYVQFANPAGSEKTVTIKSMLISSNTAGFVGVGFYGTQLATIVQTSKSKLAGGLDGVTKCIRDENAGFLFAANITGANVQANGSYFVVLSEPIVIPAGQGIVFCHNAMTAGVLLTVAVEMIEE